MDIQALMWAFFEKDTGRLRKLVWSRGKSCWIQGLVFVTKRENLTLTGSWIAFMNSFPIFLGVSRKRTVQYLGGKWFETDPEDETEFFKTETASAHLTNIAASQGW